MISIVMVDDHPMIREGIKSMIEKYANLKVLGEASGGARALELVEELRPDVLLLDLRMPDMSGSDVARKALQISPATKILILTMYDTDRDILAAIEAGASGYVLKDIEPSRLAEAIRATALGSTVLDERAARAVTQSVRGGSSAGGGVDELSEQEKRVLALAAEGNDEPPDRDGHGRGHGHGQDVLFASLCQARRRRSDVGRSRSDETRRNRRVTYGKLSVN